MVRHVSCRSHRCYSRHGGQTSARNEKIADLVHLLGCLLLLLSHNSSLMLAESFSQVSRDAELLAWILVLVSNIFDLRASNVAHRMFYKWYQARKHKDRFISAPTIVDGTVSAFCALSCFLVVSKSYVLWYFDGRFDAHIMVCSAILMCAGMFVNVVVSLPSLDFSVPSKVAVAHNVVVGLFMVGSVIRLNAALVFHFAEDASLVSSISRGFNFGTDVLFVLGSILNHARVRHLLKNVENFMTEARGDNGKPTGGLLSWFKSSRSNDEMSDDDTDFDENGGESEDDSNGRSATRRSRWTRV